MKFRISEPAGSLKPQRPSRTASALQAGEERLRIVARATNDAVWDWDLATDAVWWNDAVQTLFGYQAGEVGGDIAWWTERVHPEDSERILSGIHAVIDAGEKVWSDTYRYRRRDGSYAHVYDRGYIIYDGAKPIRMIGSMVDITKQKETEAQLKARLQELQTLHEVNQALLQSREPKEFLEQILSRVIKLGSFDLGVIRLLDRQSRKLEPLVSYGHRHQSGIRAHSVQTGDPAEGRIQSSAFKGHAPFVVEDVIAAPGLRTLKAEGARSALIVPIEADGEMLGTILLGTRTERKFPAEQVRALATIANQIGIAVQKIRHFEAADRRKAHAEALREIGIALTATHDPQGVLALVAKEARRLTGALFSYLVTPARPYYKFSAVAGDDHGYREVLKLSDDPTSRYGRGPLGRAIRGGGAVICEDVQNDPLFAPWKEIASARGIGSLVAVPLLVRGESHGAIIIYASRPRAYSEETIALLTSLAAQGAAALENARLFDEAEQRAREQAALGAIATATNQTLDLDKVLRVSLEKVKEITGRELAYIRLIDPATNRLRVAAHEGLSEEALKKLNRSRIGGKGEKVLAGGEPVVVNDSEGNLLSDVTRGQGRVSVAWFPLKVQGETVGILNVATSRLMPFSDGEVKLLQAIANVIGVAIGNAKLYEETRQSFQRIHALHELEAAVSSSLDLNSVLTILLEKIDVLFDYGAATVRLYNPETGMLEPLASRNIDREMWLTAMRTAPAGFAKDVFEAGRPLKLIDVRSDRRAMDQEFFAREGVVSYLGLPLIAKGEKIGVIGFYTKQEHDFSAQEIEFLQTIASHAAIAIKNAKLYEESERRAGEQEALSSLATATNQSLDIKEVIGITLDKVVEITGRERAYIRLRNAATGNMELIAHRGLTAAHAEVVMKGRFDGKSARVFATGEPLILNDPDRPRRKMDTGAARNAVSARIPLKARGKTIGILNVGSSQPQPFLSGEVRLLQAIANVIGVAVENARLYADAQRSLARLRALHEIDSAILSAAGHEAVLKVLLEKIELFVPYASATIRIWNPDAGALEPVACHKLDESQWKMEAPGAGWGPAHATFKAKTPLTIKDCRTDPRVYGPEFFRKHRLVSYLGIPLIAQDNALGVISFYTSEEHEFTAEEIEFVETLAGQAAVAIEHSLLYRDLLKREAQLQLTHKQLEALHSVTVQAGQSLDLDTVTQSVIDKITEIFDFDATRFYLYNEKMDELSVKGQYEKNPEVFRGVKSFARGQGNVGRVAESGVPLVFEDVGTDPLYKTTSSTQTSRKGGYKFFAALPIKGSRHVLGTMVCMGVAARRLSDGELQLLTAMAGRVAVAVENSSLYEEIKKRAAELQQKTWELETANRVKGEFLSVMSHELRTPLSVVMGYAGMLKEGMLGELNSQQQDAVQKMLSRAGDQLNVINDIMQTTQLEAGSMVTERQEIDAAKLLRDLADVYGEHLDGKDVSIRWNYPPEILPVVTDGAKLRQILQNLISNAGKFTEKGAVTISVRRAEEWVEFVVADTGIGIPQDMQTMIFEKFRQVDSSETRSYGGVGLGLYIAKQFTELLDGEITVESEVGKGTQFTVRIPAGCNSARPATGEKRQARSGRAKGETASLRAEQ